MPSPREGGRRPRWRMGVEGSGHTAATEQSPTASVRDNGKRISWDLVSSSPLREHLALAAGDAFVATCCVCALNTVRPLFFEELEDVPASDTEYASLKPSMLYVVLLAVIVGVVGPLFKCFIVLGCFGDIRSLIGPTSSTSNYYVSKGSFFKAYAAWVCLAVVVFHLLGAAFDYIVSSALLGVFFASVGYARLYICAVTENLRSRKWQADDGTQRVGTTYRFPESSDGDTRRCCRAGGACSCLIRAARLTVTLMCRALDWICPPILFVFQTLMGRGSRCRRPLHPHELGSILAVTSVLPLLSSSFLCFVGSAFLPMDWPTVYIVYPSPLVIGGAVGYFLGSVGSFLVLLILSTMWPFQDPTASASPVLEELMLKPIKCGDVVGDVPQGAPSSCTERRTRSYQHS